MAEDIQQQKAYLDRYVGGQKAQLSWLVQQIAEQLSWAEAEQVRLVSAAVCFALQLLQHPLYAQCSGFRPVKNIVSLRLSRS